MTTASTTSPAPNETLVIFRRRAGAGAAIWSAAFGLLSLYWAIGGHLGLNQLSVAIQERVAHPDTSFTPILWLSVVAKALACLFGIALMVGVVGILPRWLMLVAGWAGSVGLALYGLGDIMQAALVIAGAMDAPASQGREAAPWYLWLWGPIWLVGGVLYLAAVYAYQRPTDKRHIPR